MTTARYNLIDESWIPVADAGKASLRQIFGSPDYRALGGTAAQKIALLKLLLAVAQAAHTPADAAAWAALGPDGLGRACLDYLDLRHDAFWLYGDRPFLQMPVQKAAKQPYGAIMPEVATGNTTVLTHIQVQPPVPDPLRALLLICEMSLCLGGKKTDHTCVLTPGYDKGKTARPGPAVCHMGLLHSFLTGRSVRESVWLNLITADVVAGIKNFPTGVGQAPWEKMPEGEDCAVARALKGSLMGRLVPLARFCLLAEEGVHYTEGIIHPDYQEGSLDPSAAGNFCAAKPKMAWVDPEKRPWRALPALLEFLDAQPAKGRFDCLLLRMGIDRLARSGVKRFGIWSGGLRVSSNAGEQYVSGTDDNVESEVTLDREDIDNSQWFLRLKGQMADLDAVARAVYGAIMRYFKELTAEGDARAAVGTGLFWQLVEPHFQDLVEACAEPDRLPGLRRLCGDYALTAFDTVCPHATARQIEVWVKNRPRLGKYHRQATVQP